MNIIITKSLPPMANPLRGTGRESGRAGMNELTRQEWRTSCYARVNTHSAIAHLWSRIT